MNYELLAKDIAFWINGYANEHNISSLVIGISGGIDSAVTSALCAMTDKDIYCLWMPINFGIKDLNVYHNIQSHISLLRKMNRNIFYHVIDLTSTFNQFIDNIIKSNSSYELSENINLAKANTKARLRMTTLYHYSALTNGLVVGTGNKVEDFGVGFFTKYGDGGVDISPIADLTKTQVREMAKILKITPEIINIAPTDGLWEDGRTDEDQLGLSYEQLEWAMNEEASYIKDPTKYIHESEKIMLQYLSLKKRNAHKMKTIPMFKLDNNNALLR